jgi:hypothetical protein
MKSKTFLLLTICLYLSTGIYSQTSKINWQPTLLDIDGQPNDWTTKLRFYDSASKISFEFRNDANNLYFVIKSGEKSLYQQIETSGLTLKFVVKAENKVNAIFSLDKKEQSTGMMMPPPMMMGDDDFGGQNNMENQSSTPNKLNQKNMPSRNDGSILSFGKQPADTATAKGFLFTKKAIISSENKDGSSIRFAKSPANVQETAFEMSIPLKELFGENFDINKIATIPIKFQLSIPAKSNSSQSGGGMGGFSGGMGGPGGGMGGPGGGGPGGGGPGGDMGGGPGGQGGEMGERPDMAGGQNGESNMTKKTIKLVFTISKGE